VPTVHSSLNFEFSKLDSQHKLHSAVDEIIIKSPNNQIHLTLEVSTSRYSNPVSYVTTLHTELPKIQHLCAVALLAS
jgi:hypothetical protein